MNRQEQQAGQQFLNIMNWTGTTVKAKKDAAKGYASLHKAVAIRSATERAERNDAEAREARKEQSSSSES